MQKYRCLKMLVARHQSHLHSATPRELIVRNKSKLNWELGNKWKIDTNKNGAHISLLPLRVQFNAEIRRRFECERLCVCMGWCKDVNFRFVVWWRLFTSPVRDSDRHMYVQHTSKSMCTFLFDRLLSHLTVNLWQKRFALIKYFC